MKLESFKFQDGKVFWLPEYPERIDHACTQLPDHDCPICSVYTQDAFNSLASAIEVAPEDREDIMDAIWYDNKALDQSTKNWQPENGKVFSAECEMEIKTIFEPLVSKFDLQFGKVPIGTQLSVARQVAYLKPKDEIFPAANSHDMKDDDL